MTTITIDTLKFARKLKDAGVSEKQAEAEAEAIKDAFSDALEKQIVTKSDLKELEHELKTDIKHLEYRFDKEITLLKWMVGAILAGIISLMIKTFFA